MRREIVDLGTLPGDVSAIGNAVNTGGIGVGSSRGSSLLQPRGFVWVRGDGLRQLEGVDGATFTSVEDINDAGTAVGSSGLVYFSTHAVRWVRSRSPSAARTP